MLNFVEQFGTSELICNRTETPERELLIATLDRAVLDYFSQREEIHDEAKEWIFGEFDPDGAFSFEWVCGHLNLSPSSVKRQIRLLGNSDEKSPRVYSWIRKKLQSRSSAPFSGEVSERRAA